MRVNADAHPDARPYLDGEYVTKCTEADDVEGWVDVLITDPDQPLPKEPESVRPLERDGSVHSRFRSRLRVARLRGAVRIELGDETGG